MDEPNADMVKEGDYIVIQRHNFTKLHQVSGKASVMLGKDKLDLSSVIGKPVWSTFRMVAQGKKREFGLELCDKVERLVDSVTRDSCGLDNRNIVGDNKSQLLSTEDICELRDSGVSAAGIVTALIENSTSFKNKTEYSQDKYLKKKEKKYHEFITVRKPTLRILAEVFFNRDQFKILGLRYDTLSQMITAMNIQPGGNYLLYEKGTQGLVGAAMLNYLSDSSTLINLTLGIHPQKQAILALNLPQTKMKCFLSVKIIGLLEQLKKPEDNKKSLEGNSQELGNPPNENDNMPELPNENIDKSSEENKMDLSHEMNVNHNNNKTVKCEEENDSGIDVETKKRKLEFEADNDTRKRSKWMDELARAVEILNKREIDALIIATKEYPLEIIDNFIEYVKPSRPLVIYSVFKEPLVQLYVELKKRKNVLNMHVTETWLRNYQVLPDRTHPHVNMSPSSGFLLTAIIV